ncbi:MAG: DUF3127 domain-containing protein [Porphyromonadaceae bacterium]|nr:DUF3127 domain-containing protein [Porphyromonadaceae bacterium]
MAHNVQKNEHSLDGKVIYISMPKYISEKLTTRTIVIEVFDNNYSRPAPFTFKNGRMDCLNNIEVGNWVNIQFMAMGYKSKKEGEPQYFAENIGIACIKG